MNRGELNHLIVKFFRGSPTECVEAYERLYDFYFKVLFNFTVSRNINEMDAQDAIQEILTDIWSHRERLEERIGDSDEFRSYLIMGLRGKISNQNRKQARNVPFENEIMEDRGLTELLADESIDPVEMDEYMGIMDGIIRNKMPYYPKSVIYLYRTKHYDFPAIARMLGISEKTAKKHLTEAFKIIEKELSTYYNLG